LGGLTAAGLRTEAARQLTIMRIAGKDFVIFAAIEETMTKCRKQAKAPRLYPPNRHRRKASLDHPRRTKPSQHWLGPY
jgi:hypothetical protein